MRRPLDAELVRRGLAPTLAEASALVDEGRVTVSGAPAANPSRMVKADEPIELLTRDRRFVTRAGDKLDAALDEFAVPVAGRRALDVGTSGGGFCDCLLQRGAERVVGVEVGYGLLHERLRGDGRLELHERTNIRHVRPGDLGPPFDLVVADMSYTQLRLTVPALLAQTAPDGHLVLLVKPQYEATRAEARAGLGVIRDPAVWHRVLVEVSDALAEHGAGVRGAMRSPVKGAKGNVEFFLHAAAHDGDVGGDGADRRRPPVDLRAVAAP